MRALVVPSTGVLLIVVGVWLTVTTPPTASCGWVAYAPLSSGTFFSAAPITAQSVWGTVLAVLGIGELVAVISYRLGRRAGARQHTD